MSDPELRQIESEIREIIPEIENGMLMSDALKLILSELKRLKEIELMYKGLCK